MSLFSKAPFCPVCNFGSVVGCQVSDWQSATLLPISCKSVQPVPAWVEELVSPVRHSSDGRMWCQEQSTLSQCPKSTLESRLSKLACYCQCAICRRRRTRLTVVRCCFKNTFQVAFWTITIIPKIEQSILNVTLYFIVLQTVCRPQTRSNLLCNTFASYSNSEERKGI